MWANVDGDAASAGYGRTGGTSSSRCKCSNTTPPHGDRARPGAGRRYELHVAAMIWRNFTPQPVLLSLYDEEPSGSRLPCLVEPLGPQERIQRCTVEQPAELAPMVQILDAPVPQSVDQLVDAIKHFDISVPELVIEVPKILCPARPSRAVLAATWWSGWLECCRSCPSSLTTSGSRLSWVLMATEGAKSQEGQRRSSGGG